MMKNKKYKVMNMDLKQAIDKVIEQNKSVGFTPTRFIEMIANGDHPNLDKIISNLVLKAELLEYLEKQIDKYGKVLSIEDLIAFKDGGFKLSNEVITQAKGRSELFNKLRRTDNDWIKEFF